MPVYQVIVLAVVQGLTEFLPISSTAHLYLTSWLLGWKAEELTFDIAMHVGTLLAVLLYFLRDWVQIVAQGFGVRMSGDQELQQNRALLWLLAIGTIPVAVLGWLFKEQAETTWRNPMVMAGMLIAVGVLMAVADRKGRRQRDLASLDLADAAIIGASQALSIVPGTSRSGITITTGLFRNLERHAAARFSFLLSTPAVAGAAAKALHDLMKQGGLPPDMRVTFALGVAISAITGILVIAWFLRFLRDRTLIFFVYYRIIFGIIVLALAFIRAPAG
jgi:undecaprenyl-diphosphatase